MYSFFRAVGLPWFLFHPFNSFLLLVFWWLVGIPFDVTAQEKFNFTRITRQEGLASDAILSIIQDHQGFLWIGTENGLNRFDGQHFLTFRFDPRDTESLSGNFINALLEDSRQRLWVGALNGLNLLVKKSGKFKRIPIKDQEGKEIIVRINEVYEDQLNNIWISTDSHGLFKLMEGQATNNIFAVPFAYQADSTSINQQVDIIEIIRVEKEYMWISTEGGIDRLHIPSGKSDHFLIPGVEDGSLEYKHDQGDLWDGRGHIFLNRKGEIYFLNTKDTKAGIRPFEEYFSGLSFSAPSLSRRITRFCMDGGSSLILASQENMIWVDLVSGRSTYLDKNIFDKQVASPYQINRLILDQQGNVWLGTYGGGIVIGWRPGNFINFYQHDPEDPSSISAGQVRSFVKDDQGNLWIATLTSGLDKCTIGRDGNVQKIQNIPALSDVPNEFKDNEIIQLTKDQHGKIWISTSRKGLFKMDPHTLQFEHFYYTSQNPPANTISENRIWGLVADRSDKVWLGTWSKGLNYLDPETGLVKHVKAGKDKRHSLLSNYIRTLYLESDSILWIGARDGLSRMNLQEETFTHFYHSPRDPNSLSNNLVWSIFEDREKNLWIGTNVGLNKFNRQTGQFEHFFESNGLPNNSIYGLLEDLKGTLWVSTQDGLATKLPDQTKTAFQPITATHGLQATGFLPKAHFLDEQTGILFFGTLKGVIAINPGWSQADDRLFNPKIHTVSAFDLSGTEYQATHHYYVENAEKPLTLSHQHKVIEITLSDLSWDFSTRYKYEYHLSDFSNQWLELGQEKIMTFTNLAPGNYSLSVRKKSLDQKTSPEVKLISLRVLPPWSETWWAYLSYFFLAGGLVYSWYRFQLSRQLQKKEVENLKALDAFKNQLYTNITHEFRTPLTIISGMIDQIHEKPNLWLERGAKIIKQNTAGLLNLVNQILDLRRLESKELKMEMVNGDVVKYLRYISESHQSYAEHKGLQLHFLAAKEEIRMDYDVDKLLRIVSNLLSNAIKFTPEGGNIYFHIDKKTIDGKPVLSLRVQDTGPGISEKDLPHIFNRFYQAEHLSTRKGVGSGIGLALTRELVKTWGGSISAKSTVDKGSTFTVELPITNASVLPAEDLTETPAAIREMGTAIIEPALVHPNVMESSNEFGTAGKPNLLIVEDNPDVQEYLIACLEDDYQLTVAENGRIGIEMAVEGVPDLIVSDVMMPEKDGYELTEALKNDERTDHIPIVLLTAKADLDSRISGLEKGADAYLAKPFEERELLVRLEKLLELRQKLQAHYAQVADSSGDAETLSIPEHPFLQKFYALVEKELSNPELDMNQLCRALGMSRSQVFRKLKALTGKPATVLIRSFRLQRGKQLLASSDLTISEVAYEVGFTSLNYFSSAFFEEFGERPSATRK